MRTGCGPLNADDRCRTSISNLPRGERCRCRCRTCLACAVRMANHAGLESAKPDLEPIFKKPEDETTER